MKRIVSLLFFLLLLILVSPCFPGQGMMPGPGVKAYTGGAASGFYDLDGQVAAGGCWNYDSTSQANLHLFLDDGVRQPTAPTVTADYVKITDNTYCVFTIAEVTGSITSVRIWSYDIYSSSGDTIGVSISQDGTTWTSEQNITPGASYAWHSTTFTVSWNSTTDFRVRIRQPTVNDLPMTAAIYAEINP